MSQPQVNIDKIYLEVEKKIVNLLLQYKEVIGEMIDTGVTPEFFDLRYRPLVQAIYRVFGESEGKRLLTSDHYRTLLVEAGIKGDITIAMEVYHECRFGVHPSNTSENLDLLKRQLIDAFIHRRSIIAIKEFNENLPKMGRLEATKQWVNDVNSVLNFTEAKKTTFFTLDQLKDRYITNLKDKKNLKVELLTCCIPEIDNVMNVGYKPGHTTLIIGGPGGHKTNLMINIAINICYRQNKNVLFLPLEMDWEDFTTRVVSNIADVPYSHLLKPDLLTDPEIKRVEEAQLWVNNPNKFAIIDVEEQITLASIKQEIEKRINYFAPQLVVVDYLGLIKIQNMYGGGGRHDLDLGNLTKQLKFLGKKYGFHNLTAAQLGRTDIKRLREEGENATLDSTAIRGSQEVPADVEFIFALTAVPDEKDRLKVHAIKSRYGPSGGTFNLRIDASKCQISSMSSPYQEPGPDILSVDNSFINEPSDEIGKKLEQMKVEKPIIFAGADDLDF